MSNKNLICMYNNFGESLVLMIVFPKLKFDKKLVHTDLMASRSFSSLNWKRKIFIITILLPLAWFGHSIIIKRDQGYKENKRWGEICHFLEGSCFRHFPFKEVINAKLKCSAISILSLVIFKNQFLTNSA